MSLSPLTWMSAFQRKLLYDLLIPGTHDSGTEGFPVGSPSRTQYYKIHEQLDGPPRRVSRVGNRNQQAEQQQHRDEQNDRYAHAST